MSVKGKELAGRGPGLRAPPCAVCMVVGGYGSVFVKLIWSWRLFIVIITVIIVLFIRVIIVVIVVFILLIIVVIILSVYLPRKHILNPVLQLLSCGQVIIISSILGYWDGRLICSLNFPVDDLCTYTHRGWGS